ncbi:rod-binding protein [Lacimonas salitolerans]|uniref:Rod-binding protein n=1 Tax=Lacimonas salitolerans TaxID=1323750 RepID=A0ABW4EJD9_9RHOB
MTDLPPVSPTAPPPDNARLRRVATELEASFLAEMLTSAGLGKSPDGFGGGAGEDQFSSFLVREQARALAERGGIGLAETIFNALKEKQDD